jgi:RNA polymerase sigma factor (sigma-70 family)
VTLPPFQVLLDEHSATVHRFLVAAVGPVDADDCFQETCIAALRAYPRLEHADNLRAWLLRIAQRKALDAHRARGRRPVPAERLPEEPVPAPQAADGEPELWALVRALPHKQRTAVFLRTVADLSYEEVGAALDCSQDAARRNVHEGLARLREEWPGSRISREVAR